MIVTLLNCKFKTENPPLLLINSSLKNNPIFKILNNSFIGLPSPFSISYWWNFGSLLGLCLIVQIFTGIFLAIHYSNSAKDAFFRVRAFSQNINLIWGFRIIHTNGARLFFICLYLHIGRGIFFNSYSLTHTWRIGTTIFIRVIGTAFLGYVLPWGQMSFWGAAVITKLLSTIPYFGTEIVQWLWGDFGVREVTLSRFFTLHYLLPFIVVALSITHLLLLHQSGSNNPLGLRVNFQKTFFHPQFLFKDLLGGFILILGLLTLCFANPWTLGDPENFNLANVIATPAHIQPEWYFLFAYAILRSIPNKFGGVIALASSVIILYLLPLTHKSKLQTNRFYPFRKGLFWVLTGVFLLLTWVGARPVETPYIFTGQFLSLIYFLSHLSFSQFQKNWDLLLC